MFTNPHNQNLLNDVMRVLNGETTEQPIRPIPMWLTEAAEEAVKSLNEAYESGEVMTLEIKRDILRKHLNEAISTCADCEVTKETPLQYEEAIAEVKRVGNRPTTGVPAGASKEDHEKSRKANPFRASLGKGVPAGAKKEEFEEDELDEANQRLKKNKPYEELYYKWFDGVEVSVMDMGKISKEIQAALDTKADLNKVMPELVKKYGKNSPTKKEEFEEDELDEGKKSWLDTILAAQAKVKPKDTNRAEVLPPSSRPRKTVLSPQTHSDSELKPRQSNTDGISSIDGSEPLSGRLCPTQISQTTNWSTMS
jgi:hypothetical protein